MERQASGRALSLQTWAVLLIPFVALLSLNVGLFAAYRQAAGQPAWPLVAALVPIIAGTVVLFRWLARRAECHGAAPTEDARDRLMTALTAAGVGTWDWDLTADRLTWSDNVGQLLGLPAGQRSATPAEFRATVLAEDRPRLDEAVSEVLRAPGRDHYRVEVRVRHPDEQVRWVQDTGRVFRDADGKPVRLVGVVIDVTERKEARDEAGRNEGSGPAVTAPPPAPEQPPDEPAPAVPEDTAPQVIGRPLHVLVVEDNPVNRMVLTMLLERMGCTHAVAENGQAAVLRTEKEPFDLILMDVQMPEMDGIRATKLIRAQERAGGKRTPIVAVTANAMQGEQQRCLSAGMDDYLSKPVRPRDLLGVMGRLFGAARPGSAAADEPSNGLDWLPAMTAVGLDRSAIVRLARTFRETVPSRLVALRAALDQRDAPLLERTAHTLRGSFTAFSSRAGVGAAAEIEQRAKGGDFEGAAAALPRLEAEGRRLLETLAAYEERAED